MMTCPRCGSKNAHGARVCVRCRASLFRTRLAPIAGGAGPSGASAAAAHPSGPQLPGAHLPGAHERSLHNLTLAGVGFVIFYLCIVTLDILLREAHYSLAALFVSGFMAVLLVPIYATMIVALDRHVSEPGWLLLSAFFWGAVVATTFAYIINTKITVFLAGLFGPAVGQFLGMSFGAPVVEETAKGCALLLIYIFLRSQLNDVVDGIVMGGLVGLGFAMVENVAYYSRIYNAGGFAGVTFLFLIRSVMGGLGHSLYTGATGAGLGLAEETTNPIVKRVAPVAGYLVAIALHMLWNFTGGLTGGLRPSPLVELFVVIPFMVAFLSLPGLVTLVAITYFAWKRESKVIAEQLKDEVQHRVVRPGEYAILTDDKKRAQRVWQTLFHHGPLPWYLVRQFYNLECALAFRKWHTARGEPLPSSLRAYSEDAYREHIAALRTRLTAMGLSTE